jgi:uncharacterized protein (TIGR03435 family)
MDQFRRIRYRSKPENPQSREMMLGPMLQTILEDRFQWKIHRETKEVPVYVLTVANGGAGLQRDLQKTKLRGPQSAEIPLPCFLALAKFVRSVSARLEGISAQVE